MIMRKNHRPLSPVAKALLRKHITKHKNWVRSSIQLASSSASQDLGCLDNTGHRGQGVFWLVPLPRPNTLWIPRAFLYFRVGFFYLLVCIIIQGTTRPPVVSCFHSDSRQVGLDLLRASHSCQGRIVLVVKTCYFLPLLYSFSVHTPN